MKPASLKQSNAIFFAMWQMGEPDYAKYALRNARLKYDVAQRVLDLIHDGDIEGAKSELLKTAVKVTTYSDDAVEVHYEMARKQREEWDNHLENCSGCDNEK